MQSSPATVGNLDASKPERGDVCRTLAGSEFRPNRLTDMKDLQCS